MKAQNCVVTNKTQLYTAVGCAIGFYGITNITLFTKTGKIEYKFMPRYSTDVQEDIGIAMYIYTIEKFNEELKKVRRKIRKTLASCFK